MDRKRLSPLSRQEAIAADVLISLLVGGIGVWRELAQDPEPIRLMALPVEWYVGAQVLAAVVLLRRRSNPLAVGFACAAVSLISPVQAGLVGVYSAAAHQPRRDRAVLVLCATLLAFALGGRLWLLEDPWTSILLLTVSFVLGLHVRARRELLNNTAEMASWSQAKQEWVAARATSAERARLAAEMHDVVSHRFNAVLIGAGNLLMSESDPRLRAAVDDLRLQAAGALTELREVFGTLAEHGHIAEAIDRDPRTTAAVSYRKLEQLVAEWQRMGISVSLLSVEDEPVSSAGLTYPVAVDRALYRVVEEGLTNAAKHAQGSVIHIQLAWLQNEIRVQLTNTGPRIGANKSMAESGSGRGLIGVRERVEMLGGDFEAVAIPDGGFELSVTLPTSVVTSRTRVTP